MFDVKWNGETVGTGRTPEAALQAAEERLERLGVDVDVDALVARSRTERDALARMLAWIGGDRAT
jgi:hypothetical protein